MFFAFFLFSYLLLNQMSILYIPFYFYIELIKYVFHFFSDGLWFSKCIFTSL